MADKNKKDTMDKSRDSMRSSPQVRDAIKAEDAAMNRYLKLSDSKGTDDPAAKAAYKEYQKLAKKRSGLATSKTTAFSKGGMVKKPMYNKGGMVKANCGASMKPTQSKKK